MVEDRTSEQNRRIKMVVEGDPKILRCYGFFIVVSLLEQTWGHLGTLGASTRVVSLIPRLEMLFLDLRL